MAAVSNSTISISVAETRSITTIIGMLKTENG
jgi:hypothetical protein